MSQSSARSSALLLCFFAAAACKTSSTQQPSSGSTPVSIDPGTQVAKIDGQSITYGDVEKQSGGKLKQAEVKALSELYDTRRQAVDEVITKRLLEDEAKKKNESLEQWYQNEFLQSLPNPSEDEMKKFYEEHKAQVGGQSYDQVKDRIAQFIKQTKGREQLTALVDNLKKQHGVEVTLPAPELPRVEVAAKGPARGPDNAAVTIVEFSDFQCPFCGREVPVVERVMQEYQGKVRLVFRNFPLNFHPYAQKAAEAGACAADQGKFWQMHDKMFTNQQKLGVDDLKGFAKEIGLDAKKFEQCLDSGEKKQLVDSDQKAGEEAGVSGTPAFFVNGIYINGAVPYEQFKDTLDRELKRKG
jgi:protein-disulfide isomerase